MKKKLILAPICALILGGCAATTNNPSKKDLELCGGLAVMERMLSGDTPELKDVRGSYENAYADFYKIQAEVIEREQISQSDREKMGRAIDVLDKSEGSGECAAEIALGSIDFLAEFYDSAIEAYSGKAPSKKLNDIFERPTQLAPAICYYPEGNKHDRSAIHTAHFQKLYSQEIKKVKKCLAPYIKMLEHIRLNAPKPVAAFSGANFYEKGQISGEIVRKRNKAARARELFPLLFSR